MSPSPSAKPAESSCSTARRVQFLWATPFPFDDPHNVISNIDVKTGKTEINWNQVFKAPGENHVICYWNTRSYWPTAYSPVTNSLYTSYIDNCRDLTIAGPGGRGSWHVVQRPEPIPRSSPASRRSTCRPARSCASTWAARRATGGMLATAGDVVFHGDMSARFRAFDAATGKMLWSRCSATPPQQPSRMKPAESKYVCIMTGDNLKVPELAAEVPEIRDSARPQRDLRVRAA